MSDEEKGKPLVDVDPSQFLEGYGMFKGNIVDKNNNIVHPVRTKEYASIEERNEDYVRHSVSNDIVGDEVNIDEEWTPAISIAELCKKEFPEKKWVVENIFERATIGQVSAPPNQWKTWVMWHMATRIASGGKVFDKFESDQQSVLIVNEEDTEAMLQERASMLVGQNTNIPVYVHAEKGIKLEEETVDRLLQEAKEKSIGVIILDSLSVVHSADENSAKEMGAVFEQMKRFTREGITVLFTNHHRKRSLKKYEKDDLQEQVRGSTVINAVPAGHITCEEKTQGTDTFIIIRQAKLKGAKKLSPFLVKVVQVDGNIQLVYEGEHEESLDRATRTRNEIYAIFESSDTWLGISDIAEMIGLSADPVRKQLKILLDQKLVQKKSRAVLMKEEARVSEREKPKGQEFLYHRIVAGDENEQDLEALFDES